MVNGMGGQLVDFCSFFLLLTIKYARSFIVKATLMDLFLALTSFSGTARKIMKLGNLDMLNWIDRTCTSLFIGVVIGELFLRRGLILGESYNT